MCVTPPCHRANFAIDCRKLRMISGIVLERYAGDRRLPCLLHGAHAGTRAMPDG